ncbi:MAG: ubiquinol-cytochrome c reductase iron-sulfur subunit [Legionellales bacterium RIFCSPHIGHO2_12_FULL_35_11]|nr:MAG: ubiquinol-cytochrome c reductase iron-sulfur subunit [Legionellales bacterium RIFCSPHIGHO2_12_FULL_35_11]
MGLLNNQHTLVDKHRREFLINSIKVLFGIGAVFSFIPFISSLGPSRKTLEKNSSIRVDLTNLAPGQKMVVKWSEKPVWIIHRSQEMLALLSKPEANLRDPDSLVPQQPIYAKNQYRSVNPNYLILIGLCTHLGCSPKFVAQNDSSTQAGFYCPCHGSKFDLAGRVYKGVPAPINLAVPPHRFISDKILEIGGA